MDSRFTRIPARVALGTTLLLAAGSALAHPHWHDRDDDERGYARVLEARPRYVEVRVNVPRQRCWSEGEGHRGDRRVGSTLLGGLLGGVIGHQFGDRDGRGPATVAGAVIGGVIGHEIGESQDRRDDGDYRDYRDYRDGRGYRGDRDGRYGGDYRYDRDERSGTRCSTEYVPSTERRFDGYDVVYEYGGREYRTVMSYDPGPRLAVAPTWR
jgi:uncharacterized protein YcfJ